MTRPTARLEWFAHPFNLLAIRAVWLGAGWHYSIEWGDGSPPESVSFWQPPVPHTYSAAGTYTLIVRSTIDEKVTASATVVLRPAKSPQATLDDLGGGRVRLRLKKISDPVLHRVTWGDGSPPESFTESQLEPEHQYPAGTTASEILVQDVPARRVLTLVGPDVPDQSTPRARWVTTDAAKGEGEVRLSGFPPRQAVTVRWLAEPYPVTVDEHGATILPLTFHPGGAFPNRWHTVHVDWTEAGEARALYQPAQPSTMDETTLVPTYDIDPADPMRITLRAWTGETGTHTFHWDDGDSTDAEPLGGWVEASHTYSTRRDWTPTLTTPTRTAERRIQAASYRAITDGPDYIDYDFDNQREPAECDQAAILRGVIDGPNGRTVTQTHQTACKDFGVRWRLTEPGEYTVTFLSALQDPIVRRHTTKRRGRGRPGPRDINKKEKNHMSKPRVFVPEGYVNPDRQVRLRLLNVLPDITTCKFRSEAFAGGLVKDYEATIHTDPDTGTRYARAEVTIGTVTPDSYRVEAVMAGEHGDDMVRRWLLVEAPHDGKVFATADKTVKPGELVQWQFSGLSRNLLTAWAKSPLFVGGDDFQALVYQRGTDNAHQGFVTDEGVKPGKYPIEIAQQFDGGHREVITGEYTVPEDKIGPQPGGLPTVHTLIIDTSKLGTKEVATHLIDFGDEEMANARYGVAVELVVTGPNGQKPDLPPDVRDALRELRPLTIARAKDHITLYGGNPPILKQNKNFKIKLVVTVTPVNTPPGAYADDDPTAPDHIEVA